jgi:hypothetical protein
MVKFYGSPSKFDAVFGRGGMKNVLRKDSLFRQLIVAHWKDYCAIINHLSETKRAFVREKVIKPILEQGGHFLVFSGKDPYELLPANKGDLAALYIKIGQCLRDEKKKNNSAAHKTLINRLAEVAAPDRPRAPSPSLELPPLEAHSSSAKIHDQMTQITADSISDGSTAREEESDTESIFSDDSEPLPIDFNCCQSATHAFEDFWLSVVGRNVPDLCMDDKEAAVMPPPSLSCQTSLIWFGEDVTPPPTFNCQTSLGWFGEAEDLTPLDESFICV